MNNGIAIAMLFVVMSMGFVLALYLLIVIVRDALLIAFDEENKSFVSWNRLNTIFFTEMLSDKSKERRARLLKNIVKLIGVSAFVAIVILINQ